jgi:chemotaxis protein MotB
MARIRKKSESDGSPSAPEWMVTFSDCMTLLLTFFVLLLTFSSFDDKTFRKMEHALAEGLPSVGISVKRDREAFKAVEPIQHREELNKGNEKPTEDGKVEANPIDAVDFPDLQNRKVFIAQSDDIFWGSGTQISFKGRQILSNIAVLLMAMPNRIVVSENSFSEDAGQVDAGRSLGLERAWAVIEYLTTRQGLEKARFSVSAASIVPDNASSRDDKRALEIVLLERSIYR